ARSSFSRKRATRRSRICSAKTRIASPSGRVSVSRRRARSSRARATSWRASRRCSRPRERTRGARPARAPPHRRPLERFEAAKRRNEQEHEEGRGVIEEMARQSGERRGAKRPVHEARGGARSFAVARPSEQAEAKAPSNSLGPKARARTCVGCGEREDL